MRKKLATLLLILMTNAPVAYAMTAQDYINLEECILSNDANDALLDKFLTDLSEKKPEKPEALEFFKGKDFSKLIARHNDCSRVAQRFAQIEIDLGMEARHGPAAAHYDDETDPAPGAYNNAPAEDPRIDYLESIFQQLTSTTDIPSNWHQFYSFMYYNCDFRGYIHDAFTLGVSYDYDKKCLSPAMSKEALDVLFSVNYFYRLPEDSRGNIIQLLNITAIDAVHILKTSLETSDFFYESRKDISEKITNILFTGDEWGIDYTRTATPEEFQIILEALTQATRSFDRLEDIRVYYSYGLNNRYTHRVFDRQIQEHCDNMFLCAAIKWLDNHSYNADDAFTNFDAITAITTKTGKDYEKTFQQIRRIESAFSSEWLIMSEESESLLRTKIREQEVEGE